MLVKIEEWINERDESYNKIRQFYESSDKNSLEYLEKAIN